MMNSGKLFLSSIFAEAWKDQDPFEAVDRIYGKVVRAMNGRKTLRFELAGRGYYLKSHKGVGWKECLKNWLQFKSPALGAGDEYAAIRLLEKLELPTMVPAAFGERGCLAPYRESFLITEELTGVESLEDHCARWKNEPPALRWKRSLIRELAAMILTMHRAGMNHRDCYLCHFLLEKSSVTTGYPVLHVIDLHRAQIRLEVPHHYLVKDLAGIWFSAMDAGLTRHDMAAFLREYCGSLAEAKRQSRLWYEVDRAARQLYFKEFRRRSPAPELK